MLEALAHLTQPAQAVDVGAIREVISTLANAGRFDIFGTDEQCCDLADKLTRALGNAQVEGWKAIDGFVRVPVDRLTFAIDLLAERIYGNPARSPAHNARLTLESLLPTPPQPEE